MSKTTSITAVLVGGRETRHLRVPKQSLPFGDTTVLGKTLQAYLDAGVSDVVLVLGYKADSVVATLGTLPPKVRLVKNPLFDEGMGTFLRTGMREVGHATAGFCVGLGDQPLLTPELIEEFIKAFVDSKKKILVPAYQGSLGLPAFFAGRLAAEIQELPPKGDLWDILKRHQDDLVDHPTGYSAVVRSIDDLDDYHSMLRIAGLEIPDIPEATHTEPTPEETAVQPNAAPAGGEDPEPSSDPESEPQTEQAEENKTSK